MANRITFISHAPTEALRKASFPLDEPLEVRDIAKLEALQWTVPRAQNILSAPEQRTLQTAHALQMDPVIDRDLRDCDYGSWNGRGLEELQIEDPEGLAEWLTRPAEAPHGGESILSLTERVGAWLDLQAASGYTLAITHPAVIRSAIVCALGAPIQAFWKIEIAPLSITDLRFNGRAWSVRSVACPLGK